MNVIPAKVAGVEQLVMCSPAPGGNLNPYILVAADIAGVTDIYKIGGAQAVAAMAYGTASIPKVDKIVGPGNIYVATAKRYVFGQVDIDMIAGPSEILVIADHSANPAFVASDLLSQAEHDELASSILVTTSRELAGKVDAEVERQLANLARKEIARKAIDRFGAIVLTGSLQEAADVSNSIAPEHLELAVEKPFELLALDQERRRDLPRPLHARIRGRLHRRPEPCASHGRHGAVLFAPVHGQLHEEIQPHLLHEGRLGQGRRGRDADRGRGRARSARKHDPGEDGEEITL